MKKILQALVLLFGMSVYSQVGIGTPMPNASTMLDVVSANKGIRIPQVPLTSTTDVTTITNGNINSLLVFNTSTVNDITPGYYYWYIDRWRRIATSDDVSALIVSTLVDNGNGTFTYTNEVGGITVINFQTLVDQFETLTTLVDNGNGTYTYTSENGTQTTINIVGDVISNFTDIVSNTNVLNELIEIIHQHGGNVYYDGTTFTYIDDNGVTQVINISDIVQLYETITTLVNNGDGTYTYTSENGTVTTINIVGDVISNFTDIVSNTNVLNELIEIIHEHGGNVYYDGTTFTYIDDNGVTQVINISDIVQLYETVTTLVDNGNGTYTYTSENGTQTIIDIPGNETITTLVDNGDGTITYTNEAGDVVTVNILGATGAAGINCWDINGDGINDPTEDVNGDGFWNALDCQGATGATGANGIDGI
ncbi:hypothetical protein OJ995_11385, partial [Flavobacterium sp. TH16-21]|nr:hypothetical protein [Flavobacterium lacisediminis]